MLCSPKIGDYLEVLTEDEVKDFEMKNFREFLYLREKSSILNFVKNKN